MSNCSASCTSVRSPLIAAIATFALKADVWFRRGLLLMLSPDSRAKSCPLSGRSSTYRPVQILEAGSGFAPALIAIGFGVWAVSPANTPASPSLGQGIEPLQIMVNAKELPTVEYADYTFVFAD